MSHIPLYFAPVADSTSQLHCSTTKDTENSQMEQLVHKSVEVVFRESDATWLIFYSHPVYVRCYEDSSSAAFVIQATRLANATQELNESIFTSRVALMNNCTMGTNPSHCTDARPSNKTDYGELLHKHADVYPGKSSKIDYTFSSEEIEDGGDYAYLQFDFDAHHVRNGKLTPKDDLNEGLIMFSLPHHREMMDSQSVSPNKYTFENDETHCTPSLNGDVCLVEGSSWVLKEYLVEPSFNAPRPPLASAIRNLSNAISKDIHFRIPGYFLRGAGDTYFSGKILAKLGRILLITRELEGICAKAQRHGADYVLACRDIQLPTSQEFNEALDHLRSGTEIWINGTAETPFVYDEKWGGICSCGCDFNDKTQSCDNAYPDCPAFSDPGLDFGHAFYNDHHFHQGYHIYAFAVVAHFDNEWGKKYFEHGLVLIRDIANPSPLDEYFPQFRMKDWYLGNSWAGGIARVYPNGRNQESSSESIAAYEAVALYGKVMAKVFEQGKDTDSRGKASVSRHIRDTGRLLTSTELRSADRYWHVRQTGKDSNIYPKQYKPLVVGIMWNMMAQFQTWFGNAPHLAYGIQLLPLTPISEQRDSIDWVRQLYPSFASSCSGNLGCKEEGWGILQHAVLSEVGHPNSAIKYAESLPKSAFLSAGGNGHSLTNTIWYYATRPEVTPLELSEEPHNHTNIPSPKQENVICAPCTKEECTELGFCPVHEAPYLCTDGVNKRGCSVGPWDLHTSGGSNCNKCCKLTHQCH